MVGKKAPVKRLTVAKSASAPRSKKLNLDKLLISIKKISTRYNKNGKMTGGNIAGFENVKTGIENFFMTSSFKINTALQNMLEDILKMKDEKKKQEFLEKINNLIKTPIIAKDTTTAIGNLLYSEVINTELNIAEMKVRIKNRIDFFYKMRNSPHILKDNYDLFKDDPHSKKALSYISITQIATTLAIIYKFIEISS